MRCQSRTEKKPAALLKAAGFFHETESPAGRLPAVRGIRKIEHIGCGRVDDGESVVFPLALEECRIGLVYMAVDHDGGPVPVQQGTEAFESAMGHRRPR